MSRDDSGRGAPAPRGASRRRRWPRLIARTNGSDVVVDANPFQAGGVYFKPPVLVSGHRDARLTDHGRHLWHATLAILIGGSFILIAILRNAGR